MIVRFSTYEAQCEFNALSPSAQQRRVREMIRRNCVEADLQQASADRQCFFCGIGIVGTNKVCLMCTDLVNIVRQFESFRAAHNAWRESLARSRGEISGGLV